MFQNSNSNLVSLQKLDVNSSNCHASKIKRNHVYGLQVMTIDSESKFQLNLNRSISVALHTFDDRDGGRSKTSGEGQTRIRLSIPVFVLFSIWATMRGGGTCQKVQSPLDPPPLPLFRRPCNVHIQSWIGSSCFALYRDGCIFSKHQVMKCFHVSLIQEFQKEFDWFYLIPWLSQIC